MKIPGRRRLSSVTVACSMPWCWRRRRAMRRGAIFIGVTPSPESPRTPPTARRRRRPAPAPCALPARVRWPGGQDVCDKALRQQRNQLRRAGCVVAVEHLDSHRLLRPESFDQEFDDLRKGALDRAFARMHDIRPMHLLHADDGLQIQNLPQKRLDMADAAAVFQVFQRFERVEQFGGLRESGRASRGSVPAASRPDSSGPPPPPPSPGPPRGSACPRTSHCASGTCPAPSCAAFSVPLSPDEMWIERMSRSPPAISSDTHRQSLPGAGCDVVGNDLVPASSS